MSEEDHILKLDRRFIRECYDNLVYRPKMLRNVFNAFVIH